MFGRGKNKEEEFQSDLPLSPFPEYMVPKERKVEKQQPQQQAQIYNTRPQAMGDVFKMEKLTQGKNNFVIISIMAPEKSVERFKLGRTMLVQ